MRHTRAQTATFTTDWSVLLTWVKGTTKRELKDWIENFTVIFHVVPVDMNTFAFQRRSGSARSGSAHYSRGNDLML